jgi:hypothetical protein
MLGRDDRVELSQDGPRYRWNPSNSVSEYNGEREVLGRASVQVSSIQNAAANTCQPHGNSEFDAADLRCITDLIGLHQSNSAHCYNEDVVFIMGNTGAGKSTTINYLCGRKVVTLRDASDDFIVRLDVQDPIEGCAIGHGGDSRTRYLQSIIDPAGDSLVFCDTPGFEDTEGSSVDIANAVAISWTIRQCRSVRLVLLLDASLFGSARGVELNKLLQLFKRFLINADANLDSVRQRYCSSARITSDSVRILLAGASPYHPLPRYLCTENTDSTGPLHGRVTLL